MNPPAPSFVDFFAGSGLVTQGAQHACVPVWFNGIFPKRAATAANKVRVSGENQLRRR
jgi:site-specific DNA-cytosine methylase